MDRSAGPAQLTLRCRGPLILLDAAGADCTPRNAKTCGLLALLALAPELRRSRRWVEKTLWSDRAPEQASGSLRQALSELRKCMGSRRDALISDRRMVALDPALITLDPAPDTPANGADLFEGLDLRDPVFDAWLATERKKARHRLHDASGISVVICPDGDEYAHLTAFQIAQNLSEMGGFSVLLGREHESHHSDLKLKLVSRRFGDGALLTLHVLGNRGQILWSVSRSLDATALGALLGLANETTDAVVAQARSQDLLPPEYRLRERALDEMLSFDAARLRVAEGLLTAASGERSDAAVLAWRAVLRLIMINERTESDLQTLTEETRALAAQALEKGRDNPSVTALLSQIDLFLGAEVHDMSDLVQASVGRNASAVFAQTSLAAMALRAGRVEQGQALAQRAVLSAGKGRLSHWAHMVACIAQITGQDFAKATHHAETARQLAPAFRMPTRHLYALDVKAGHDRRAGALLREIQRQTPDFSLRMIRETPEFPAATLRSSGLAANRDVDTDD